MMRNFFATIILLLTFLNKGYARSIISGISSNEINIDTNFRGTEIVLFGAKGDAGNIIIVVSGPKKDFLITKKEKFFKIWYNGKREIFKDFSSYHYLFSTYGEDAISKDVIENLNLEDLNFSSNKINSNSENDFHIQLINKLEKDNLYNSKSKAIGFLDETLFKVILKFPKNILQGIYNVEIYLISDSDIVSFQSIPIYVNQVGLSATISNQAYDQPFIYGILCVLMAVVIGWIANYIFAKFFNK